MRAQWGIAHTTNPEKAKPYIKPEGTSGICLKGECCIDLDGKVYRCIVDQTDHRPTEYPDGWEEVELESTEIQEEA